MPSSADEQLIEINGQTIKIPAHVAIIVDGNGRWAKERGLTRMQGHDADFKNLKKENRDNKKQGLGSAIQ